MMVGAEDRRSTKYTTVSFQDGSPSPHPQPASWNIKYSDVRHLPITTHGSKEGSGVVADRDLGDGGRMSPSYVGVGVCQPHSLRPDVRSDNPNYNVLPPPVPVRFESQEVNIGGGGEAASSVPSMSTNPFMEDPFGDRLGNSWGDSDPTAFYDRPRNLDMAVDPQQQRKEEEEEEEDGYQGIGKVLTATNSTADFTGDSAYEDTASFLQEMRSRYKNKHPDDVLDHRSSEEGGGGEGVGEEDCTYDLPPVEMADQPSSRKEQKQKCDGEEEEGQGGGYDFPFELNRYPFKEDEGEEGEGGDGSVEEPTLHTMLYPVQAASSQEQPPEQPQGKATGGSLSPGSSDAAGHCPRHNVPLPLTPDEQDVMTFEGAPPLPARPGGAAASVVVGAGPGEKTPSSREGPLPSVLPSNDRPRLPPFNHPWGNKPTVVPSPAPSSSCLSSSASLGDFPPLPPRKKNPNGHFSFDNDDSEVVPPPLAHQPPSAASDEPGLADLLNRGFQQADIERAMRIARNDYEMAKSILQEFGGRH